MNLVLCVFREKTSLVDILSDNNMEMPQPVGIRCFRFYGELSGNDILRDLLTCLKKGDRIDLIEIEKQRNSTSEEIK